MRVDIYITSKFHGKIAEGNGVYAVLLDTVLQGRHYRKLHIVGWNGLSFQKLAVRAAVDGIQYMTAPSEVIIGFPVCSQCDAVRQGRWQEIWGAVEHLF